MCSHPNFKEIKEKLRPFLHGWRIFKVLKCDTCKHEWEEMTGSMVYGRGNNWATTEERHEIKIID